MKKIIGVIGGMGPLATSDLFNKLVRSTVAASDNEHPHVIIDSNTNIPDRTAAILGHGESPLPQLIKSAQLLQNACADFLIMPCNTAHYFLPQLQSAVSIPILNMLEITLTELKRQSITAAGLLATDGTMQTRIYENLLEGSGITVHKLDSASQAELMRMIYSLKAGHCEFNRAILIAGLDALITAGAQTLILGCTELPIAFAENNLSYYPLIDPTLLLALQALAFFSL